MKIPTKIGLILLFPILMPGTVFSATLQNEALAAHNHWRALHHAAPLVWDFELQHYAERYASHCVFKHSNPPTGENLAAGYVSVTAAVNAWMAEEADYSYQDPGFSKRTGHFTQVVWAGTEKLGCATADCSGKNGTPGTFLVCEYSPAGNITNSGYFQKNVKKP